MWTDHESVLVRQLDLARKQSGPPANSLKECLVRIMAYCLTCVGGIVGMRLLAAPPLSPLTDRASPTHPQSLTHLFRVSQENCLSFIRTWFSSCGGDASGTAWVEGSFRLQSWHLGSPVCNVMAWACLCMGWIKWWLPSAHSFLVLLIHGAWIMYISRDNYQYGVECWLTCHHRIIYVTFWLATFTFMDVFSRPIEHSRGKCGVCCTQPAVCLHTHVTVFIMYCGVGYLFPEAYLGIGRGPQ